MLLCLSWAWACTKGMRMLSTGFFPASKWCCYLYHCTPDEDSTEQSRREYLLQWEATLRCIACSWKDTQSIAASLLLVSALAVLQLDDVLRDTGAMFTCTVASIVLALACILSSFIYILSKEKFISHWKTTRQAEAADISFWRCIAMPLDFVIWSFFFNISTVFILVYQRMLRVDATSIVQHAHINPPNRLGAAIITILSVISAYKVYNGLIFFYCKN
ncbi:hypothetical protein CPC08DRAFT_396505 [Agrocybe pediades]|nr:hypothetical protein CPC08DRAFT_396505 [Agrocybe pediades]